MHQKYFLHSHTDIEEIQNSCFHSYIAQRTKKSFFHFWNRIEKVHPFLTVVCLLQNDVN